MKHERTNAETINFNGALLVVENWDLTRYHRAAAQFLAKGFRDLQAECQRLTNAEDERSSRDVGVHPNFVAVDEVVRMRKELQSKIDGLTAELVSTRANNVRILQDNTSLRQAIAVRKKRPARKVVAA
jgi:hypothetical protein